MTYMQIAVFVSSNDALKPGWLLKFLKDVRPAHIKEMQQNLAKVCNQGHVEFYFTLFSPLLFSAVIWLFSCHSCKNFIQFPNVKLIILCLMQMLVAIINLDIVHFPKLIFCAFSCLPVWYLMLLFSFSVLEAFPVFQSSSTIGSWRLGLENGLFLFCYLTFCF